MKNLIFLAINQKSYLIKKKIQRKLAIKEGIAIKEVAINQV